MKRIIWTTNKPNSPGVYHFRCWESGGKRERLRIYMLNTSEHIPGELYVDDPDIGHCPLDFFHKSLADVQWSTNPVRAT